MLPDIEKDVLSLLHAERMTVYQRSRNGRFIVSKFKSGDEIRTIRVPLSNSSVAGFVALHKQPVNIDEVYDPDALRRIHPDLRFGRFCAPTLTPS